jgi:hypothetical protein
VVIEGTQQSMKFWRGLFLLRIQIHLTWEKRTWKGSNTYLAWIVWRLIIKKCLCYEHGSQKGGEETEQTLVPIMRKLRALFLLDMRNHQQCFNSKQKGSPLQPSSASTEESTFGRSCKLDESTFCCFSWIRRLYHRCICHFIWQGKKGVPGPPIRIVDVGSCIIFSSCSSCCADWFLYVFLLPLNFLWCIRALIQSMLC